MYISDDEEEIRGQHVIDFIPLPENCQLYHIADYMTKHFRIRRNRKTMLDYPTEITLLKPFTADYRLDEMFSIEGIMGIRFEISLGLPPPMYHNCEFE